MPVELPSDAPPAVMPFNPAGRRVAALMLVFGIHVAIFLLCGWLETAWEAGEQLFVVPDLISLVLTVALLQAWCSLGAIWWARSRWPSHVKTLVASFLGIGIWAGMVFVLTQTSLESDRGAGWLASLATQGLAAALGTLAVEHVRSGSLAAPSGRFTILFLLIWTTVIAALLGTGRLIAESLAWTSAVLAWEYFPHLQVIGLCNAALAVGIWTVLQRCRGWLAGLLAGAIVGILVTVAANLLLAAIFSNVGAEAVDLCWLYGGQTLFLLATLVPLKAADASAIRPQPAEASASPQIPPRPDSGR